MKLTSLLLIGSLATTPALAAAAGASGAPAFTPGFQAEAGVSYFIFDDAQYDNRAPAPTSVDESDRAAPFVAATYAFTPQFGLRLSYQFVNNAEATAEYSQPPGSLLPIVVWGNYRDDIHVVGLAPEFSFGLTQSISLALAPKLNWVASRGRIAYMTNNPTVQLVGPMRRNDDGFTLGASVRLTWAVGQRTSVNLGYEYVDLDPSFDRKAHVLSAGVAWRF